MTSNELDLRDHNENQHLLFHLESYGTGRVGHYVFPAESFRTRNLIHDSCERQNERFKRAAKPCWRP